MAQWLAQQVVDGVHVLPLDDLVEHRQSVDCWCKPDVLWIGLDGEPVLLVRKMVTHQAADGRE